MVFCLLEREGETDRKRERERETERERERDRERERERQVGWIRAPLILPLNQHPVHASTESLTVESRVTTSYKLLLRQQIYACLASVHCPVGSISFCRSVTLDEFLNFLFLSFLGSVSFLLRLFETRRASIIWVGRFINWASNCPIADLYAFVGRG